MFEFSKLLPLRMDLIRLSPKIIFIITNERRINHKFPPENLGPWADITGVIIQNTDETVLQELFSPIPRLLNVKMSSFLKIVRTGAEYYDIGPAAQILYCNIGFEWLEMF